MTQMRNAAKHLGSCTQTPKKVLPVDSREPVCTQIAGALQQAGFGTAQVAGLDEAREALGSGDYSAVIIHHGAVPDALAAFCREARSADEWLVILPAVIGCDERLELELFDSGVDDVVTDGHTPQALAKRLAVRIAGRQRMN